jgi:Protein of unknown function (DUF2752)
MLFLAGIVTGYIYLFLQPTPVFGAEHETFCLFHLVTGLPCPVCGTGRGLICLLHGNFHEAFLFNPICYVVFLLSLCVVVLALRDTLQKTDSLSRLMLVKIPAMYYVVCGLLLLANEIWNIHKGL